MSYLVEDVNAPEDLVAIADAPAQFGVSKRTLERLIAENRLSKFKRRGDKRLYVSRADVMRHLGFREVRAKYD